MRLLKIMYDPYELADVLMYLRDTDGWMILGFREPCVLEPILDRRDKMLRRQFVKMFFGTFELPEWRQN